MPTERQPIPRERLPPRWGPAEIRDGHFAYRRDRPTIVVIAERTAADSFHPGLGVGKCWELHYRLPLGEFADRESIGRVPTRSAALEGLLECMDRVHERVDGSADPGAVRTILEGVSFGDPVSIENPTRGGSRPI